VWTAVCFKELVKANREHSTSGEMHATCSIKPVVFHKLKAALPRLTEYIFLSFDGRESG